MTRSRKRKLQRSTARWAGLPLASAAMACGSVAYAQQAQQAQQVEAPVLEEVIVTAQKRSEDLQKVPISLLVLSSEKLDELQVKSFDDFAKFLPSVSYQSLGPGQAQLYFRGVASGGDGLHAGSLPASGLYLDEIPVTTVAGSLDIHVYDMARVEALAGPQGTLYGASSLSGTLRLITNKPDKSKFSGSVDVKGDKFSKGNGGGSIEGYVNVPLSDRAAVRLVGYYEHDGGYTSNVPATVTYNRGCGSLFDSWIASQATSSPKPPPADCSLPNVLPYTVIPISPITFNNASQVKNRTNDVDTYGGRAALKIDLNDHWSITPSVLAQHQQANGSFIFDPKVGDLKYTDFRPGTNLDRWVQSALTVEGKLGNFDAIYSGGYFVRHVDNQVDYTGYTIAYDGLAAGYTRFVDSLGNLGNQDPTQYTRNFDRYTKVNHEIRFSSPTENRLRWVGGAFLQHQTDNIRAEFRVDGLPLGYQVTGQGEILYLSQQDRTDRDYAVFSDLTYDLTDKLKLSGGIRGFRADNTLFGFFGYNSGNSGQGSCRTDTAGHTIYEPAGSNRPCINTDKRVTENGETHKVNLTYQIDPDHMIYGTYSTGFRPGGNNRRVEVVSYKSDKLSNYEFGWKTSLFDRRVRFNGAIFLEKWKDIQIGIQGVQGITSILNVGSAEVKGVESDINWAATEHLTLSVSGTYVNAKTTSNFCPATNGVVTSVCATPVAPSGTQLPVTPKFKGNGTARFKFNVGQYESFAQAAIVQQGSTTFSLEAHANSLVGDTPGYTTLDLSAGTKVNGWRLEAYAENVTDKRGEIGRTSQSNTDYSHTNYRVYPIKPLEFGFKVGRSF